MGKNKLNTSEIPNLQILVSVIQNTNFSWAQFVQHYRALYRMFCGQHCHCCMSQGTGNSKSLPALTPGLFQGHLWLPLLPVSVHGHNGPFSCWELFLSVFYHLLLSVHPQLSVWLDIWEEGKRPTKTTPTDTAQKILKVLYCYVMVYLPSHLLLYETVNNYSKPSMGLQFKWTF